MNDKERFMATMTFRPADRPPNHELGLWGQTAENYIKAGMPEEIATGDFFRGIHGLGLDHREFVPINMGPVPAFEQKTIEETDRYVIYQDGEGMLHKALKEGTVRGTRLSMDQYMRFAVEKPEDFQAMKKRFDPNSPGRYPTGWADLVPHWNQLDCPLCLFTNAAFGFYSHARRWMGTENLSYAFYDYPDMMHEMMEFLADFFIEVTHKALHELKIDYFNFFEDMAGKGGPLMSPAQFREFILPHYKRVIDHLRAHGVEVITLDSDGDITVLIPLFLEAGVTALWPMEVAAGMDVVEVRLEYGESLAIMGGIDKRELAKTKKDIEKELLYRLPPLLETGGYIPTVDHTVPPDVSYENFLYYMDLKQKIMEGKFGA